MAGISPTISTGPFVGNGATTAFSAGFTVAAASEVTVYVNGIALSPEVYSVTLNLDGLPTVHFNTAPVTGASILLTSSPDFTQTSEFEGEGDYNLATINTINRRQTVRTNWLARQIAKIIPVGALSNTSLAGRFLGWDADNNPATLSGTGNDSAFRSDAAAGSGATLVGFSQPGGSTRSVAAAVREARVSISDFGAVGDNSTDDRAAFVAAMNYLKTQAKNVSTFYQGSQRLYIPAGAGYFSDTIDLKGGTFIIEGEGNGFQGGQATTLRFPANTAGFRIQRYNTITNTVESPTTRGADATIIRNLMLLGAGTSGNDEHSGIWMRARASLENIAVNGFAGNGIWIKASQGSGGQAEGNANCWQIRTAALTSNHLAGLKTEGADSNAGMAQGLDCSANVGWGIWENSFLGNTYVACHIDGNSAGQIKAEVPTARNVFLGGYVEVSGAPSSIIAPSMILGGFQGVSIGGTGPGYAPYLRSTNGGLILDNAMMFMPGSSVTPADNGHVTFQLTNNTTITFKAKGSDGIVRSGTITLA